MKYTVGFRIVYTVDAEDEKEALKIAKEKLREDHTPKMFRYNVKKD